MHLLFLYVLLASDPVQPLRARLLEVFSPSQAGQVLSAWGIASVKEKHPSLREGPMCVSTWAMTPSSQGVHEVLREPVQWPAFVEIPSGVDAYGVFSVDAVRAWKRVEKNMSVLWPLEWSVWHMHMRASESHLSVRWPEDVWRDAPVWLHLYAVDKKPSAWVLKLDLQGTDAWDALMRTILDMQDGVDGVKVSSVRMPKAVCVRVQAHAHAWAVCREGKVLWAGSSWPVLKKTMRAQRVKKSVDVAALKHAVAYGVAHTLWDMRMACAQKGPFRWTLKPVAGGFRVETVRVLR